MAPSLEVELRYPPVAGEDPLDEILTVSLYATSEDTRYLEGDVNRSHPVRVLAPDAGADLRRVPVGYADAYLRCAGGSVAGEDA